jgi:Transposase DDE domain
MAQSRRRSGGRRPCAGDLLPLYQELFSRPVLMGYLQAADTRLRWCLLTPLVMLWGLVFQRLSDDHTTDAVVSYLRAGGADALDPDPRAAEPLSRRLRSESNSAYVQGRNRLPLALLHRALGRVCQWLAAQYGPETLTWKGHAVRVLDGTTFRMPARPALAMAYGRAAGRRGVSDWTLAKSVVAFCLHTQAAIAYAEGRGTTNEVALARRVMEPDPVPESVFLADRAFGSYRFVQIAHATGHPVVVRLRRQEARRLLHTVGRKRLPSGTECRVVWEPQPGNRVEADLPQGPLPGRFLYLRIQQRGYRPFDVYLFTTLLDRRRYSLAAVGALYAQRWAGELDYRHVKATLEMEEFDVKSPEMFRKELAAGLLTYNLICAWMTKAAQRAEVAPTDLSFSRCARRVRDFVRHGAPDWVKPGEEETWLLERLAQCRVVRQPNKVAREPRQVRRRPQVYPALKGSRKMARRKLKKASVNQHRLP